MSTDTYYHLAPVILTDDIYTLYGGRTGTSTAAQRTAAYLIAEILTVQEMGTFLLPTQVTGTWEFNAVYSHRFLLPHHHLISVDAVTMLSQESLCNCDLNEDSGCAFILNTHHGILDMRQLTNAYMGCGCTLTLPYQVRCTYTAGLPTGVAADDAALHLALAIVAELNLLEIIDPAALEGGPGDPGVREYVNMGYGEKRVPMLMTTHGYGNSARANKARKLIKHLKPYTALGFSATRLGT